VAHIYTPRGGGAGEQGNRGEKRRKDGKKNGEKRGEGNGKEGNIRKSRTRDVNRTGNRKGATLVFPVVTGLLSIQR